MAKDNRLTVNLDVQDGRGHKEAKIILLGAGGVGKTSLVKQLLSQSFDPRESLTHGVTISNWTIASEAQTIHLWDFGGQEATHQLFFSDKAIFLLIIDERTEKNLGYWLNSIDNISRDSTVLLVSNKIDQSNAPTIDLNALLKKYPILNEFFRISCKTGAGIETLKTYLIEQVSRQTPLPEDWHSVKSQLLGMREPYISIDQFQALCDAHSIAHTAVKPLLKALNALGILIYYDDFDLSNLLILDPQWFVNGIYTLIGIKSESETSGVIALSELISILNRDSKHYPEAIISHLIRVMEKFELCFFINSEELLLPGQLPIQEPDIDIDLNTALKWIFAYTFLPATLIIQLIVRLQHLEQTQRWRHGLVCTHEQNQALIKSDPIAGELFIAITGNNQTRRGFLQEIRNAIVSLDKHYQKLQVKELIPLPDEPKVRISYAHLLRLEKQGEKTFLPDGYAQAVNIKTLLYADTVETQDECIHSIAQFSIKNISIKQFKNIEALDIDLSSHRSFLPGNWACFAGVNAAGKSSVLQAINIVLMGEKLAPELGSVRLGSYCRRDQQGVYDAEINCTLLLIDDAGAEREVALYMPLNATTGIHDKKLRAHPDYDNMLSTWALLHQQLILSYGPNRSLSAYRDSRHIGNDPYILGQMTLFDPLSQIANLDLFLEQTALHAPIYKILSTLLEHLLPDSGLTLRIVDGLYQFYMCDVAIDATELPDGFRSTLAWLADLCAGWHIKSPTQHDPGLMHGLVMIDEVDLHLHPSLQRLMIPTLRKILPNIQWIVTTHSPMILSSFDRHELFVLRTDEDSRLMDIDRQITGFSIDQIYEWLMQTPAQSKVIEDKLAEIEQDRGKTLSPEEKSLVSLLIDQSPEVSEAQAKAQQAKRRAFLKKLKHKP